MPSDNCKVRTMPTSPSGNKQDRFSDGEVNKRQIVPETSRWSTQQSTPLGGHKLKRTPTKSMRTPPKDEERTCTTSTEEQDKEERNNRGEKRLRRDSTMEAEGTSVEECIKRSNESINLYIEQIKICTGREVNSKISFTKPDRAKVCESLEAIKEEINKMQSKMLELVLKTKTQETKIATQEQIARIHSEYKIIIGKEMTDMKETIKTLTLNMSKEIKDIKEESKRTQTTGYEPDTESVIEQNREQGKKKTYSEITQSKRREGKQVGKEDAEEKTTGKGRREKGRMEDTIDKPKMGNCNKKKGNRERRRYGYKWRRKNGTD